MVDVSLGRGEEEKEHDPREVETFPNLTLRAIQQLNPPEKLEMRTFAGAFSQFQTIKYIFSPRRRRPKRLFLEG